MDYDIYHFHDISGTFSPIALNWLAKKKPVVWTFHDCSPITGGCINPLGCNKLYTQCNHCPQLNEAPIATKIDFTGVIQSYKRKFLNKDRVTTITPSKWLANEAVRTVKSIKYPKIIPNSVDSKIFKPLENGLVRKILGLPQESFVVLLSASYLDSPFKGTSYALNALKQINHDIFLIVVGTTSHNKIESLLDGFKYQTTGYIYNDQLLAQYYASADIFLYPTLADSFGCVVIETMSCGTPCIAFNTGGVPEIIDHDLNGWLVPQKDVQGLVEGLTIAITQPEKLKKWGISGQKKVKKVFSQEKFLESHLSLYNPLFSKK